MNLKELAELKAQVAKGAQELKNRLDIFEIDPSKRYRGTVERRPYWGDGDCSSPFFLEVMVTREWSKEDEDDIRKAAQEVYGPNFEVRIDENSDYDSWESETWGYLTYPLQDDSTEAIKEAVEEMRKVIPLLEVKYVRQRKETY